MKSNISVLNAIMRITCGLTVIAWATSRLVRRPNRFSFLIVAMLGAMKVAEGIHRYCPVTDLLKENVSIGIKDKKDSEGKKKDKDSEDRKKEDRDKEKSSSEEEED